jgi:hypothetical protein
MKTWFITLPLLCAAGFAHADGMPGSPAADEAQAASAQMEAQAKPKLHKHKLKRLPHGDMRHCLELSSNAEIIACAEKRRRR